MLNQNISSNKFDLNLTTTLSSYWCTAIFTKSRSLHYVLKSRGKLTKKWTKPKRTTPSKLDHVRSNRPTSKRTTHAAHRQQRNAETITSEQHWRKEQRLPNRHTKEKKRRQEKTTHQLNLARITASKRHRRNHIQGTTLPTQRTTRNTNASRNETQTVKKRQQTLSRHGNRNNDVTNDASQIKAEDLRKLNRIL